MRNILFYTIAGGIIGLVAQLAGASLSVTLLLSLVGPPVLLLIIAILRNKKYSDAIVFVAGCFILSGRLVSSCNSAWLGRGYYPQY